MTSAHKISIQFHNFSKCPELGNEFGGQAGGWNALPCVLNLNGFLFTYGGKIHNSCVNILLVLQSEIQIRINSHF